MTTNLFVNVPVKDLDASKEFFAHCGFTFNPQFTDDKAACMIIGATSYIMLLREDFFSGFTPKTIVNAHTHAECLLAVSVERREEVDLLYHKALERGAGIGKEATDHGFMYQRSFTDLDGHWWEVLWMDPGHVR